VGQSISQHVNNLHQYLIFAHLNREKSEDAGSEARKRPRGHQQGVVSLNGCREEYWPECQEQEAYGEDSAVEVTVNLTFQANKQKV
jgi:hypothetical protein